MDEPTLVLTGPLPLAGGPSPGQLRALVAADVLARRAGGTGAAVYRSTAILPGGHSAQRAAEEDLAREGLDAGAVGAEAFAARMGALAIEDRCRIEGLVDGLGLALDIEAAVLAGDVAALAARTAFVRLFDAGLVVEAERVVSTCPRCATSVAAADTAPADLDGEILTLRLALIGEPPGARVLEVTCEAPELLLGVVAVAVPEGWPFPGASALVPVADASVPVVVDAAFDRPTLLVPAHDPVALELCRRLGLAPVPVVDGAGTICAPGPLAGLGRYAARAAARRLLEADGALAGAAGHIERVGRCPACSTVLIPILGHHWFLAMADLVTAAGDAVRDGRPTVRPATAREVLLAAAPERGEWCLTQQVRGGVPVPVGRCLDCGQTDVSVHPATSCGKCMGDLAMAGDVLDGRFVRSVWPLTAAGWPEGGPGPDEPPGATVLVVAAEDAADVLPMVALGLRLGGAVPFDDVAVVSADPAGEDPGGGAVVELAAGGDRSAARVAAIWGGLDAATARALAGRIEDPPVVPSSACATVVDAVGGVAALAEALTKACDAADLGSALRLLDSALSAGVPADDLARVRALAGPFVGA